jgi:hypothetical protein
VALLTPVLSDRIRLSEQTHSCMLESENIRIPPVVVISAMLKSNRYLSLLNMSDCPLLAHLVDQDGESTAPRQNSPISSYPLTYEQ